MIIVKNRELLIPETERYIGTTYDHLSENRQFKLPRVAQNGVDLSALTFRLDLKYANDTYDTVILSKEIEGEYIVLTWEILSAVQQVPGTLYIAIRATDGEAAVRWASFGAVLYVERHLNTPGNYTGDLTEIEQMELDHAYFKSVIQELEDNLDYAHDAEAWATGKRNGEAVPSTDEAYHNNAKYYKEQAASGAGSAKGFSLDAEAWAKGTREGTAVTSGQDGYHDNAKYYAEQAAATVDDTNTRFNNAMAAVTVDTEVVDARVGVKGSAYSVLKVRLDSEHNDLQNQLDKIGVFVSPDVTWESGSIYTSTGQDYNSNTCIRTGFFKLVSDRLKITFPADFYHSADLFIYNSESISSYVESAYTHVHYSSSGKTFDVPAGKYCRVVYEETASGGGNPQPEDITLVQLVRVDETLTQAGAAADAKVTGDEISLVKSQINAIDDVIKYYIYTASKTLLNRYTSLKSGISLKKDIEYIATWTFSQAALDTVYCYLVDSNDTNIFPGSTSMTAGKSSFTVTFTPSADLDNITAKVYAGSGSGLVDTVCNFKIESTENKIATIEKKISGLLPSAVGNMKTLMPFTVGSLNNSGEVSTTFKKRISSTDKLQYTETISVKMTNDYRIGYCEFVNDTSVWHGWYSEVSIPPDTLFRLQCARPSSEESASSDITDPYVNDIIDNMQISGLPDSILELQKEVYSFEFGHNGLKCEEFMNYGLWKQGAAHVKNLIVGFMASNDSHTNTATYDVMEYENGYVYHARGNHNLGHCASADYNEESDTMLVANGTYAEGVVPTVYLITNAYNIVNTGGAITVNDSNVIELPFSDIEGEGCVACFGENSNIMYVLTTENALNYSSYGGKYLYKMFLGKGSTDLTSLYPNDSYGTFISGKADSEYNGTVRVLKEYVGQYFIELQGMKYVNGRICFSCDLKIDNILTAYLLFVKTVDSNESIKAENAYWIPSTDSEGNYIATEAEGVVFAEGNGYVTIYRDSTYGSRTLKFSLLQ